MRARCSTRWPAAGCSTSSPPGTSRRRATSPASPRRVAPSSRPTASARASRSACSGAGCWRKASRSTSRTAPSPGATRRAAMRPCIASSSASAAAMRVWRRRSTSTTTSAASRMRWPPPTSTRISSMRRMWCSRGAAGRSATRRRLVSATSRSMMGISCLRPRSAMRSSRANPQHRSISGAGSVPSSSSTATSVGAFGLARQARLNCVRCPRR